jgi:hypothetical protein
MTTFAASLDAFVAASPWLTDEHEPDLTTLRYIADKLDADPDRPAPLLGQFGLTLRGLRKSAPPTADEDDELEAALPE